MPDEVIRSYVQDDERLLWSGQPLSGIRFRAQDWLLIPFSLLWCGFVLVWETAAVGICLAGAQGGGAGLIAIVFPLFGLPFVLIGLYLLFGRFFTDARARANTYYGVTTQRIFIVSGRRSRKVKSLNLPTLSEITMTQKADGTGTLTFGAAQPFFAYFAGPGWPGSGMFALPAFDLVPDVAEVYRIIRDVQKTQSQSLSSSS